MMVVSLLPLYILDNTTHFVSVSHTSFYMFLLDNIDTDQGHFRIYDATPSAFPTGSPSEAPTIQPTFTAISNPIPMLTTSAPSNATQAEPGTPLGCCAYVWNALQTYGREMSNVAKTFFGV